MSFHHEKLSDKLSEKIEKGASFIFGRSRPRPIIVQNKKGFFQSDPKQKNHADTQEEARQLIEEMQQQALFFWQIKKIPFRLDARQNFLTLLAILAIIAFGLFTDNLLFSIIAILSGLLLRMFQDHPSPDETDTFGITKEGVFANDSFYDFSDLESFWVFSDQEENRPELFLVGRQLIHKEIHFPIVPEIAEQIYTLLAKHLPAQKPRETLADQAKRFFHF